ncbi:MAG: tetratricopeptide repeat protein [Muribaculaceae bacterium]|nr:tetratricopeptide repeat protein [Muribaculaceae bacterium]
MKKTVLFGIFTLLNYAFVNAADYESEFYEYIEHERYSQADSILSVWRKVAPHDPELVAADFNLLVNQARQSVIELTADISNDEKNGDILQLTDSVGNVVGHIKDSVVWNDSIYEKALGVIDHGIEAYPRRLDFRLGKAWAESEREHWAQVVVIIENILNKSEVTDFDWLWTEDEPLGQMARSVVGDAVFAYLSQMANESADSTISLLKPLAERTLYVFPQDCKILNLIASLCAEENDFGQSLVYLQKAHEECPDDGLIAGNIAYLYYMMGDKDSAIRLYKEIIVNERYEDNVIENAKIMLASLEGQNVMTKYEYFFRYLPSIARQIDPYSEQAVIFEEPEIINTKMTGYNQFKSPFEDNEIHSDAFEVDEMRIYVWTFPEPADITECLYVAFIPDSDGFNVFTLEKSIEDMWVIGHMKSGKHFNYGHIPVPDDVSGFLMALREKKLLKMK